MIQNSLSVNESGVEHIFLSGSFKPSEIVYAIWQPNYQVKFSRRAERERRESRLEEEIGRMGRKGVMGCYVVLVVSLWLKYHAYGCDGYPWGVCILMMLSNSPHGANPHQSLISSYEYMSTSITSRQMHRKKI